MAFDRAPGVRSALLTHQGCQRSDNQDRVDRLERAGGGVYVVADGMGGHQQGERAAQLAVEGILGGIAQREVSLEVLEGAFQQANRTIFTEGQRPEARGMGTTATALWLDLPYALLGHVGDSRAYLLRQGRLLQLTQDHSWVAEQQRKGLLTAEEARTHQWRNVITNALGTAPSLRVDLLGLKLQTNDRILLCSDGLSGVVAEANIAQTLAQDDPTQICQQLIDLANQAGGPDNISTVVVIVESPGPDRGQGYSKLLEQGGEVVALGPGSDATTFAPSAPQFWRSLVGTALAITLLGVWLASLL
jgi:serine/threonine protein phosphatase PrpC